MGAPSIPNGGETATEDGRKGAVGGQGSVIRLYTESVR